MENLYVSWSPPVDARLALLLLLLLLFLLHARFHPLAKAAATRSLFLPVLFGQNFFGL